MNEADGKERIVERLSIIRAVKDKRYQSRLWDANGEPIYRTDLDLNKPQVKPKYEMSEVGPAESFDEICEWEPRMRGLYRQIQMLRDDKRDNYFCRLDLWYGQGIFRGVGFKNRMAELVGFAAVHPEIQPSKVYSMAYQVCFAALPMCRNCGCACGEPRYQKDLIPSELRWEVWARDNYTCRQCGARKHLAVDHIYPESKGGQTIIENLQTLCKSCNSKKHAKVIESS